MNVLHMVLVKIGQGGHNFSMHDRTLLHTRIFYENIPLSHIELVHVVVLTEPTQDNAIQEIQTRIWASLKSGYKYSGTADDSEKYLRPLVGKRLDLTIMYVDLVGSTSMSLEISQTKFITIISSFVHEMAHAVKRHNGYVLKFVGDAAICILFVQECPYADFYFQIWIIVLV